MSTARRADLIAGLTTAVLAQERESCLASSFTSAGPGKTTGSRYKLELATAIVTNLVTPIPWVAYGPAAGVTAVLWTLTLAVQPLCIEPPDLEEEDLH